MSALFALHKAIHALLSADPVLTGLLGGARIYAEPPRGEAPPYLLFGEARMRDWSTATDRGHEHMLTVEAVVAEPGAARALAIAAQVETLLDGAALALDGYRLVNLAVTGIDLRREGREPLRRAVARLRAVTETL